MNIVICQINSKYVHSSLAAWCLKAGVITYAQKPCSVFVAEGTINESAEAVLKRITEKSPDLVGFCCYIWNIGYVVALAKRLRDVLPDCKIAFGGPEVSYNVEETLRKYPYVDFVLSGEGEYPFAVLCDNLNGGTLPDNLGICYRKNNEITLSEPYIDKNDPPSPYCDEYFSCLQGRMVYFETSRGCPYRCAFCLSGRCGGVRYFNMDRIKSEILTLASSGTKTVKFVDRTFNANKVRAKEIIRFITENYGKGIPESVCFHFEIAGDILDDELICLLITAPKGLFQLEIGMQSFNPVTLAEINRKTNCELLKNNITKLVRAGNMHIHIDLIAGLPEENLESFNKSFNTAYQLKANMLQLGFLKLLHGADMRENSDKYPCVFSKEPPYEVLSTPSLSSDDIALLKGVEDAVERIYNSGRFSETLEYFESSGLAPFEIFERVATNINDNQSMSFDLFAEQIFKIFSEIRCIDPKRLRDLMVCDRMRSVADGKIPDFLRREDAFLKTAKHFLEKSTEFRRPKNTKRAVGLLYSENCVVWCDYTVPDKVSGHYPLKKLGFEKIIKYCD